MRTNTTTKSRFQLLTSGLVDCLHQTDRGPCCAPVVIVFAERFVVAERRSGSLIQNCVASPLRLRYRYVLLDFKGHTDVTAFGDLSFH